MDGFGRQDGVRKTNDFFVELCLDATKAPTPFPATKDPLDRLLYVWGPSACSKTAFNATIFGDRIRGNRDDLFCY
jgi:hypothetical protein